MKARGWYSAPQCDCARALRYAEKGVQWPRARRPCIAVPLIVHLKDIHAHFGLLRTRASRMHDWADNSVQFPGCSTSRHAENDVYRCPI